MLRGGYGMFYNRNMGNVEYDNYPAPRAQRLPGRYRLLGRRQLRQRPRPDLRHDSRGDARQPHRQPRHQHADARLVQVPEDAQLQRVVRAAHPVEPGGRGQPTSAPAAATWSAAATATSCRSACSTRALSTASTCRTRSTAYAVASEGDQPVASFRQFNALNAITRSTTSAASRTTTRCRSRSAGRPAGALQYFVAYTLGRTEGTLGGEYSHIDPYDPGRTYGVLNEDRTHILNVSWNAFLPDGAQGRIGQRRSAAAC